MYTNSHLTKLKLILTQGHRGFQHYTKEGGCLAFGEMLRINKSLTNFCLEGCLFDPEACLLFEGLQSNTTLTHLNLKNSLIWPTKATGRGLCAMLKANKTLTHLDLSGNYDSRDKSFSLSYYIFQGLLHNKSLVHLNLGRTGLVDTVDSMNALSKMLQVNNSLKHLNLSNNDFGVSFLFFQSLQHNTTLVHLNLSETKLKLTGPTLEALSEMLQVNNSLAHIDISKNIFSGTEVSHVFQSLRHNTTLVHLNLCHGFGFTDAPKALFQRNCINTTLTYLDLSAIQGIDIKIIFQDLQHNTTLLHLYLRNTGLVATEETAQALTTMLQVNKTLTHFDLSCNNNFSDSGAQCVFAGLRHNTTLTYLDLMHLSICTPTPPSRDNVGQWWGIYLSFDNYLVPGGGAFDTRTNARVRVVYRLSLASRLDIIII